MFDDDILDRLNKVCKNEPIHFIGLGAYDFQLSFEGIDRIQTMEKAVFSFGGDHYTWEEGPANIPVWLLIGQIPTKFELPTPLVLRMNLVSGDYVEFYTAEHKYEATVIDFGLQDDMRIIEIY
ncbi:MAG: hypothetical protein AAFY56_18490 [Pseudomonadota bacterium]